MSVRSMVRRYYRPTHGALLLGIIVTLFVLLVLQGLPFFVRSELSAYDFQLSRRGPLPTPGDIVFVALDESSINFLAEGESVYPTPRHWMATAVDRLRQAGARVIALDFVYTSPTHWDATLARAMKRAGNVVVANYLEAPDASKYLAAELTLADPTAPIRNAAAAVGLANFPTGDDGAIRDMDLEQAGPGGTSIGVKLYPAFALQVAALALHTSKASIERSFPSRILINYIGKQNPGDVTQQRFLSQSFSNVVIDETPTELRKTYHNKIVIIGCGAVICNDIKISPYGSMYGAVIEANAVNTLLRGTPITPAGSTTNNMILVILAVLTTFGASRFNLWRSSAAVLFIAAGYVVTTFILFDEFRLWINLITPEVLIVLIFAAVMALRFATEERQRRRTGQIFGQYVKPEIVEMLINSPDEETALAGGRRPISVLFVDIRGFTRMSEAMEPEDVVKALDIYLEELTGSVDAFDGTLDKYVGDELMAIWNAPRYQHDHAMLAICSALDMVSRVQKINAQLVAQGLPAIQYGIGVNSGDAVVGRMGSSLRKQYDVIGDTVNTAARLCSAAAGGEIIIGEQTFELIGHRLEVEETEPLTLKGKNRPFRTFLVLGLKPQADVQPIQVPAGV